MTAETMLVCLQAGGGNWNSLPDRFSITSKTQQTSAQDVLMQRILGDGAQSLQSQVSLPEPYIGFFA